MRRTKTKLLSFLLALVMVFSLIPAAALQADDEAAATITVTVTVSDKGVLAQTKTGEAMAQKEVVVFDLNDDGSFTYEEALFAAHEMYCPEGTAGFSGGGYVSKLWGTDTSNCLFFTNNAAIKTGVTADTVNDGDKLTVSINADDVLYADYYSFFDYNSYASVPGEAVTGTLSCFMGMNIENPTAEKASGVDIGIWKDGEFVSLGVQTDSEGKFEVTFDEVGTYVLTAKGTASAEIDAAASWTLMESAKDANGKTIYGKMDWTTYDSFIGYTEEDYGEGPYPWDEIKWIDLTEFKAETFSEGYLLYSGLVTADEPLIAPSCIVTVAYPFDTVYEATQKKVKESTEFTYGNEWKIFGLARDGLVTDEQAEAYFNSLAEELIANNGKLDKFSDYERVLITLTALGYDPTDVATFNILDFFTDFSNLQGPVNNPIFALIAIDTRDYVVDEEGSETTIRDQLIDAILGYQKEDGGWQPGNYDYSDPDMTAMAIQALAPYCADNNDVLMAVSEGLDFLTTDEMTSSESYSQYITALLALSEVPEFANLIEIYGPEALLELEKYYVDPGQFKHLIENEVADDYIALPQAYYTLVGLNRYMTEQTTIYDISDVPGRGNPFVMPFTDVAEGSFYYDAVAWALSNNITTGTTATTFSPDNMCLRGQVVTFLWRYAEKPEVTGVENPFTDVQEGLFYYEPVLWAISQDPKITTGTTATTFSPDNFCLRGQAVTFLWRLAGEPEVTGIENPFTDVSEDDFYYDAVMWALQNGITTGTTDTTFSPNNYCLRGQVVTFLHRYALSEEM